ncbi:DEAD/DEAH box helicase family protein [Candidatus Mesenet endosymbiont of Phosphuga atrata]|uniref:DEAD/DEAH box helicase family protein n=1 Tax=Candidatus Mesenet endosymbiont of Phosphuga atrata TaxID=3066221 RepID=UPI0030D0B1A4
MLDSAINTQELNLDVKGILNAAKSLFPDLGKKDSNGVIAEIKELDQKLYSIQKSVFKRMLEHIKDGQNPNILLDIATGFGKSFIQISFAGILENAKTDYRIVVPDNLISQFKNDVDKFFSGKTAEQIKSKIKGHKEFFIKNWQETRKIPKSTFLMIDEVDSATKEDLYRQRFEFLRNKCSCISLSATSQEWLYKSIEKAQGKVISISLEEKIKEMGIIPAHSINATANSVMKRTNKRSGFLPYACIIVTSYLLTLLFKIYLNSYTIEGFTYFSTLYNFYNFYLNTFIYHPIIGQISLAIIAFPIVSLVNLIVNKIADRDISGRLIANLVDVGASSPAHEDICKTEETFIYKKTDLNYKDINIQSPRGKKSLVLACNDDMIRNLNLIYRDEKNEIYKNGKLLSSSKAHDQYKLGKDFGEKYDFSYKESQRNYCIAKCREEIGRSLTKGKADELINKIDFSNTSTYSEYRVMHGIINSALLALLQKCHDDQGNRKYGDVIALNKARAEKLEDLYKDVENALKDNKGSKECIRKYLKDKGFQCDLQTEMAEGIKCVVEALETRSHIIIENWELDRKLHNMMKIGDEYQVLDDLCGEFKKITESTPGYTNFLARFKNNSSKFHNLSDDYFDDVYKTQLERYLEKEFGSEVSKSTKKIYSLLKSQDYPALYSLLKDNNLMQMRNNNERKFPLYKLREICKKNKIVFDNLGTLKIDGPFIDFDEEGNPKKYELLYKDEEGESKTHKYTSKEVTKLFTEGWIGTLVDPSKSIGFSDPTLQNVAILINENDDEINNPDKIYQGYGRNRGLDVTQQPFFRMIARKGIKLCFDVKSLMAKGVTSLLFKAREKYNKESLKTISTEISEEVIQYISNYVDNKKEKNDEFSEKEKEHIEAFTIRKLVDLYNRNDHDLKKTKKESSRILKNVKKNLISYEKNVKNQGKPSALYAVPYYIAYIFSKILYYPWTVPSYITFSLRTIGNSKVINNVASAEATYVHIVKNYTFADSIENQKIIKKFLELSQDKNDLFNKLLNSSICKKALKNIISPLQDEYILTILNSIYPSENNDDKVRKIRSLFDKIKNKEEVKTDKETINSILEVSKEIAAAQAWYHDSHNVIGVELPRLKNDNEIFYIRNVGNAGKFFSNFLYRSDGKFSLNNEEGKEYRKNYGNAGLQTFIFFIKWFPLLVVFPQIPYLCTDNVKIASAVSTIVICIPLMAFVFGCPEKFRSIIFNKQISACNELEFIANKEKIPFMNEASGIIKDEIRSNLKNIEPFTEDNIKNGNSKYTNPIKMHFTE